MADAAKPEIEFHRKMLPLLSPARYKVLYGGRGGIKSHSIARALLIQGVKTPLRILCARELMKSIKDSVHRLLTDLITQYGLQSYYTVQQTSIKGANGTEFFFEGLRHNAAQIKSYEGVDIVWVEEAATVSKASWDYLIPTIRKERSEIWLSLNPELETDETYQRFVVNPPAGAVVINSSWRDNRWFPDVLRQEMATCRARSEADYLNIWEGQCRQAVDGAIYMSEMTDADRSGRITSVPHHAGLPVNTFWDLGWADNTAIWFVQRVGLEYHVIDYYASCRQPIQHYIQTLQALPYVYGTDYLPHDARAKQLGTGKSIEELMVSLGRRVEIVPSLSVLDGINAARTVFGACWFDKVKCADGLQALRRYRYDIDDSGRPSRNPLHDENSHAADAWRYFALVPDVQWDVNVDRVAHQWGRQTHSTGLGDWIPAGI